MAVILRSIVERFPHQRVLVVGDVMLDQYVTGDCSRISPEAPVPVVAVTSARSVLGGAANTAANVASLSGRATLIGLIGDDEAGGEVERQVSAAGIGFIPIRDGRSTARKVRVVGHQQQLLRLDYETVQPVGESTERAILDAVNREMLDDCSVLIISDYAKGLLTEHLCQELIQSVHRRGTEAIVDPRPQHGSFYTGCDYITPNWKESLGLAGLPDVPASETRINDVGMVLAGKFRSNVLLTLGAQGMRFYGRDGSTRFGVPTVAKEVFDVSGAGDTVVAAFALARAAGCNEREAVDIANRAAGLVVAKLGTATISPGELLREEDEEGHRLLPRVELRALADRLRARRRLIVTLNGSFDLLHAGHLHIIQEARRQGDVLIVGLNSDASVRRSKGPERPIVPEAERARMLLALRWVDYVHVFDEYDPIAFLEQVRPDVHVNGAEYGTDCVEAATVRACGGRLHLVDRLPGLSSSILLSRSRDSR